MLTVVFLNQFSVNLGVKALKVSGTGSSDQPRIPTRPTICPGSCDPTIELFYPI